MTRGKEKEKKKKPNKMEKENAKIINQNTNCNVFTAPVYGASFPLPGSNVTINQFYGKDKQPKEETKEGHVESTQERDQRKTEVMKAITGKFEFADENLGYDHKHQKITNERIALLFRKCLGINSYPTAQNKLVMEQLWVLLMDQRNQCTKEPGEDFFRQTVLNIIGYFATEEIVCGMPREIARCIFPDADTNIAKNVSRGIGSNVFPENTSEVLDYYMDKLMEGEF